VSEWWSVVGGIVCCEKKKIWGCLFVHRGIRGVEQGPGGRARRHGAGVGAPAGGSIHRA
jgi:hypothetical protein